ncbi:aldehyde dehydrogenase [candidate division BRC1 bacterium HGW-BRC1-1]|jgi:aldehyde dehydrogenase (NAD+)|nr:MAG: aldehyde dehydrogenase [candidate division BRC1 bacterium HGW-BRC1-1]
MASTNKPKRYKNFIGGKWTATGSEGTFQNVNPADVRDVVGVFPAGGKAEVDEAVAAAKEAYAEWRLVPAPKRAEIIRRAGDIMVKAKDDISQTMTREMGKVLAETRGDTQEGIDTAYYTAGEGRRMFGDTVPCELPNKFGMSVRMPVGVCGMITPWNFPMAIPTWKIFPALVAGNTVVLKPATDTPATSVRLVEILLEAGLPPKAINIVCGGGRVVGNALVQHPDVSVISFTGSTEVGKQITADAASTLKRVSLELGGKNAQIVMDDADLELALEGAVWGAFGTTGQRCTATSRLILHKKIAGKFIEMLVERTKKLRVGNGLDAKVEVGPVVNESQRDNVAKYVEIGLNEDKATLALGGHVLNKGDHANGWFFEPTIFTNVKPRMRIAQEEIFGPVLSVITVKDFDEAIRVLNDTAFGLSSSIYTRDVNRAFQAIRDIEAGITYVNGPTIGAEVQLPFGGVKGTGNGHREASHTVLDIFTEWKSVYIDYSGKLQRAQIDVSAG